MAGGRLELPTNGGMIAKPALEPIGGRADPARRPGRVDYPQALFLKPQTFRHVDPHPLLIERIRVFIDR